MGNSLSLRLRLLFEVALALGLAIGSQAMLACAHAESLQGGVLRKGELTVFLGPVPSRWKPLQVDGADVAYRDDANEGSAMFDVRCMQRDGDAPLRALTEHLIMGTTEREIASEETIAFDGREALHTRMRAKLDGVPMQYDIFVMKKDGCVHDLVYVAPPELFDRGVSDFERFALGLHTASPPVGANASGRGLTSGGR